ncbi:MAG: redox-sensing transcriptional repressor Rex [Oscillospiraceae bacterium]|nr:redox-sensing transcriptional repressor Rex [Oscillospiraceae bacterium]
MGNKPLDRKAFSDALARRLPAYYRHVCIMLAEGKQTVTSSELAKKVGNTSAQVRQDFFTCGGVENYHPDTLKNWLSDLLGINKHHHMVVIGAGNLGRAIISFKDFNTDGFFIDAVFDNNLMFDGMQICGIPILNVTSLEDYLATNKVDIVVITTPAGVAEEILEKSIKGGVKGIWNFAPVDLRSSDKIEVQNVHLSDSLLTLSFRMNEKELYK